MKTKLEQLNRYGKCPECGMNWDAGDIPKKEHKHYSPPYKYSKVIGVEDPRVYDGVSWWACPDCKTMWNRWTGKKEKRKLGK